MKIVGTLITVIKIIVPALIIIKSIMILAKAVLNADTKSNELVHNFINKIIIGILIFFIPTAVDILVSIIGGADSFKKSFSSCEACLVGKSTCTSYISAAESNKASQNKKTSANSNSNNNINAVIEKLKKAESDSIKSGSSDESISNVVADNVYNGNDITQISNLTAQQLKNILTSSKNSLSMNNNSKKGQHRFASYADVYIEKERQYGINAIFLVCQDSYESGYYNTDNWVPRNCNNLGGIKYNSKQTYESNGVTKKTGSCVNSKNINYAKFDNIGGYIDYHAKLLSNKYTKPGQSYYHGTKAKDILIEYCPSASDSYKNFLMSGCWNKMKAALQ